MLLVEFKFTKSHINENILFQSDYERTIILCIYVDEALMIRDIILFIYVDDALMIRDNRAIKTTMAHLRSNVFLKDVGPLKEYV